MVLDLEEAPTGEANQQHENKGQPGKMAMAAPTAHPISLITAGLACVKLPLPSASLEKVGRESATCHLAAEPSVASGTPAKLTASPEPAECDDVSATMDFPNQSDVTEATPVSSVEDMVAEPSADEVAAPEKSSVHDAPEVSADDSATPASSVEGAVAEPIVEEMTPPDGTSVPDAPEASADETAIAPTVEEVVAASEPSGAAADVIATTEPPMPPAAATCNSPRSYGSAIAPGLANLRLPLPSSLAPKNTSAATDRVDDSPAPPPSIPVEIGVYDEVTCAFGRGRVSTIREDGIHVVQALGWQLANEARPVYYMAKSALKRARPKALFELSIAERLERATFCKERGAAAFGEKRYENAAGLYYDALRSLEVQEDLSNEERARMLDLMVPCHNNVAMCQLRLSNLKEAITAASNAHRLCEALADNVKGQVMACLRKRGVTDHKVFVQWKAKALFLAGKANVQRAEWEDAIKQLEAAVQVAEGHPGMDKEVQGFQRLLKQARDQLKAKEREQKKMWKGAFQKNSVAADSAAAPAATAASNGAHASNGPSAKAALDTTVYSNVSSVHVNGTAAPATVVNGGFATNGFGAYMPQVPLKAVPKVKVAPESSYEEAQEKGARGTKLAVTTALVLVAVGVTAIVLSRRKH